jgi:hypothetical protein
MAKTRKNIYIDKDILDKAYQKFLSEQEVELSFNLFITILLQSYLNPNESNN